MPLTTIRSISDSYTDTTISTTREEPQFLLLSEYERKWPSGRTKYTFGRIDGTGLADNVSKIMTLR